jgi:hypothetical protein
MPLTSPVVSLTRDVELHVPSLDGGVTAEIHGNQEHGNIQSSVFLDEPDQAHHDRVSSISSSQQDLDTPALTHNPNTPVLSPASPPTPKHGSKSEAHLLHGGRHWAAASLLDVSKEASSQSKGKSWRTSSWTHEIGILAPKSLQRRDTLHSNPLGMSLADVKEKPQPVSLFKILSERQPGPRPASSNSSSELHTLNGKETPVSPSCILRSANPFSLGTFCATEASSGHSAWFCRNDNLVIFDGMTTDATTGELTKPITRSSKGLSSANKRGELAVVNLDVECAHCREVMGLKVWKYEARVCSRSVCAVCKVLCRQKWSHMTSNLDSNSSHPPPLSSDNPENHMKEEDGGKGTLAIYGYNIGSIRF